MAHALARALGPGGHGHGDRGERGAAAALAVHEVQGGLGVGGAPHAVAEAAAGVAKIITCDYDIGGRGGGEEGSEEGESDGGPHGDGWSGLRKMPRGEEDLVRRSVGLIARGFGM